MSRVVKVHKVDGLNRMWTEEVIIPNHPGNVFAEGRGDHSTIETPVVAEADLETVDPLAAEPNSTDVESLPETAEQDWSHSDEQAANAGLYEQIAELERENAALLERIESLERRINELLNRLSGDEEAVEPSPEEDSEQETTDDDQPDNLVIPAVVAFEADQPELEVQAESQEPETEQDIVAAGAGILATSHVVNGGQPKKKRFAGLREKLANMRGRKILKRGLAVLALAGLVTAGAFLGSRDNGESEQNEPTAPVEQVVDEDDDKVITDYDDHSGRFNYIPVTIDGECIDVEFNFTDKSVTHEADNNAQVCNEEGIVVIDQDATVEDIQTNHSSPVAKNIDKVPEEAPEEPPEGNWKSYQDEQSGETVYTDQEPDHANISCTDIGGSTDSDDSAADDSGAANCGL